MRRLIRFLTTAPPAPWTAIPRRERPVWSGIGRAHTVRGPRVAARPSDNTRRKSREVLSEVTGSTLAGQAYADRRARPLARLFFTIARPALVFIRALKPCLRFRLRMLGWKVRFVTTPRVVGAVPSSFASQFSSRESLWAVLGIPGEYSRAPFFHVNAHFWGRPLRSAQKPVDGPAEAPHRIRLDFSGPLLRGRNTELPPGTTGEPMACGAVTSCPQLWT
jgi:hypothetical protein